MIWRTKYIPDRQLVATVLIVLGMFINFKAFALNPSRSILDQKYTTADAIRYIKSGVQLIFYTTSTKIETSYQCSGIAISDDTILTNKHCIEKPFIQITIIHNITDTTGTSQIAYTPQAFTINAIYEASRFIPSAPDLAIIKITKNPEVGFLGFSHFIDLRDPNNVITDANQLSGQHDQIFQTGFSPSLGYPLTSATEWIYIIDLWGTSYASSIQATLQPERWYENFALDFLYRENITQSVYKTSPGDSGGAVIVCDAQCKPSKLENALAANHNQKCRLAGIHTASRPEYKIRRSYITTFATNTAKRFIQSVYSEQGFSSSNVSMIPSIGGEGIEQIYDLVDKIAESPPTDKSNKSDSFGML